jgi:hypothetical protein
MLHRLVLAAASLILASAGDTPIPDGAKVYFGSPGDSETVSSPVKVGFGLAGIGVAPAGTVRNKIGHHHLVIDAELPGASAGIQSNENYRHFGGQQTETSLKLVSGKHTLQLLTGDFKHVPHSTPITSKRITVIVK